MSVGTALHWMARNEHEAMVQLLVVEGADTDVKDTEYERTPLSYIAQRGHKIIVQLLLEKGADLDAGYADEQTLLSWATENGNEAIAITVVGPTGH